MAISKYTLYKYVKVNSTWRYCKAAYHDNSKIKPDVVFVNVKEGLLEKHPEGRYYKSHNGGWIDAGTDALEAQRKRKQRLALDEFNRLSGKTSAQSSAVLPGSADRITLAAAAEKYFANCEARGLDPETIRKYRAAVDPFVEHCGVAYVDECRDNKQVLLTYMGWLRKQPVPSRRHSNPERTLANRVGDVRIFLKEFGITKLLKKNEEPRYHEKKVVAHPDDELDVLYGAADAEETFLLDFFIGSMARDHEAYGKYGDPDLTGTTLTLYGKHHKTRTVEISQRLADAIRERRKHSNSKSLFVNGKGKPDKHLLRKLQHIAKAGPAFHTELHKLRKTGASRRYLANVPLPTLMLELGHESLAVTQNYLADARKPGEAKKAVADADFIPKPNIVKTGTHGD